MDLVFDSVRKEFDEKLAVEIPALTVRQGEFFTFVGPSGCSKSTTLNLIAGLEPLTRGRIRLGDRDLTHLPPHKHDVAFVFQTYALYPHRTVFRNMAFPLELAGADRATIRKRVQRRRCWGWIPCWKNIPDNFPAANGSAWPWDGPLCGSRGCFYSTNRFPTWMRHCAPRCAKN